MEGEWECVHVDISKSCLWRVRDSRQCVVVEVKVCECTCLCARARARVYVCMYFHDATYRPDVHREYVRPHHHGTSNGRDRVHNDLYDNIHLLNLYAHLSQLKQIKTIYSSISYIFAHG